MIGQYETCFPFYLKVNTNWWYSLVLLEYGDCSLTFTDALINLVINKIINKPVLKK